jgi:hypothetical protein
VDLLAAHLGELLEELALLAVSLRGLDRDRTSASPWP